MKEKNGFHNRTLTRLLALCLVCVCVLSLMAGCKKKEEETFPDTVEDVTKRNDYTAAELSGDDERLDQVVARCGDQKLTNRMLQVYYYTMYYSVRSQSSKYSLDLSKPLSEQQSTEQGLSWEQLILRECLEAFHEDAAIGMKAKAADFLMPEEYEQELQQLPKNMEQLAKQNGASDAETFLQSTFGAGVTVKTYADYFRAYYYLMSFEKKMYDDVSCTDEELLAFYEANKQSYPYLTVTDKTDINVRHILIKPEDGDNDGVSTLEEKAAAKEKAEALLAEYLENPTEAHFAELANANSTDPGSNTNGGLYENVYPGQMVETFNDWCFDESRRPGDTGIVLTNYGCHVMYFVSRTEDYHWKQELKQGYVGPKVNQEIKQTVDAAPLEIDFSKIILAPLPKPETADK